MKKIAVTQRADRVPKYDEVRDCLDQRWADFLMSLDMLCLPLPNTNPANAASLLQALSPEGIIFSGGNTLSCIDPEARDASQRRDDFERALLDAGLSQALPMLGVCRGMQFINVALGGKLCPVGGHVASRHKLVQVGSVEIPSQVNSYHAWTIPPNGLASQLRPLACDADGNIEAFEHESARLMGIMWHPEREPQPDDKDAHLIRKLFE